MVLSGGMVHFLKIETNFNKSTKLSCGFKFHIFKGKATFSGAHSFITAQIGRSRKGTKISKAKQ